MLSLKHVTIQSLFTKFLLSAAFRNTRLFSIASVCSPENVKLECDISDFVKWIRFEKVEEVATW